MRNVVLPEWLGECKVESLRKSDTVLQASLFQLRAKDQGSRPNQLALLVGPKMPKNIQCSL